MASGGFASAATDFAGAASSLFAGFGAKTKAQMYRIESQADLLKGLGAQLEGQSYQKAHDLALTNEEYAKESTAIQGVQATRATNLSLGAGRAAIGASGLEESGSALDVLADSARQGELHRQIVAQQGLISEAGYQEQADVYTNMVAASGVAVEGAKLASKEHLMAADAEETAAMGNFITAGIKGVAGVAALFSSGGGGLSSGDLAALAGG